MKNKIFKFFSSLKDCKYFKSGVGKCPFGNKCFYLHAYPDGTKTDVGPPPRQRRAQTEDGEMDFLQVNSILIFLFLTTNISFCILNNKYIIFYSLEIHFMGFLRGKRKPLAL